MAVKDQNGAVDRAGRAHYAGRVSPFFPRARALVLILIWLAASACNQTEGDAVIRCEADAEEGWPGCPDLPGVFEFQADFFALRRDGNVVEIRLQQGGRGADVAEGFQIQVFDAEEIADSCLAHDIPLEVPEIGTLTPERFPLCRADNACTSARDCPLVRMALHFPRTCPARAAPLVAGSPDDGLPGDPGGAEEPGSGRSTIRFISFGTGAEGRVTGSFSVGVVDGRTQAPAGRCETMGEGFTFLVKEGQPYVRFVE